VCPAAKKAIFDNGESDQSVARRTNPNFGLETPKQSFGYGEWNERQGGVIATAPTLAYASLRPSLPTLR
jgi:hypothetical protein